MVCHMDAMCKGGIMVYNAYLWTSEGLSTKNEEILEAIMGHRASHGKPWFAAGDFQIPVEVMQESCWPGKLKAALIAPPGPTCMAGKGGSTIDDFLVDRRVKDLFGVASTFLEAPFKPHHLVEVKVRGSWQKEVAKYMKKPRSFPRVWLIGPHPEEKDWGKLQEVILKVGRDLEAGERRGGEEALDSVWRQWNDKAEEEIAANLDLSVDQGQHSGRKEGPELVQRPVLGWGGQNRKAQQARKESLQGWPPPESEKL